MPARRTTPKGYQHARELRKALTPAEAKLWAYLRGGKLKGAKFRRQHALGNYVPDFCSIKHRLVIELDGSQHLEQEDYDAERTAFFESKGYRVLRIWNNAVMNNIDDVLKVIHNPYHNQTGSVAQHQEQHRTSTGPVQNDCTGLEPLPNRSRSG